MSERINDDFCELQFSVQATEILADDFRVAFNYSWMLCLIRSFIDLLFYFLMRTQPSDIYLKIELNIGSIQFL
jgi:hypothetical protein